MTEGSTWFVDALSKISIAGAHYTRLSVERRIPPAEGQESEESSGGFTLRMRYRREQSSTVYEFRSVGDLPDIGIDVSFSIRYEAEDPSVWDQGEFIEDFGRRVALMNVYPYLRVKIHELAASVERRAPLLNLILQADDLEMARVSDGEDSKASEASADHPPELS